MLNNLRSAFSIVILMTLLTGLAYPLAITGIAQVVTPAKANGSLVVKDGRIIGSALVGQDFRSDRYFWPRPSATSPEAYNADASGGSNYGPTSVRLRDRVAADIARLKTVGLHAPLPADAVTSSGSGLDPDISRDYAHMQVERIAESRGVDAAVLDRLVDAHTRQRLFGFIGEPRVNVLEINLALDAMKT